MDKIEAILLKNIKIARKAARITLKDAGEIIGLKESTVRAIECGKIRLTAVSLYKLCKAYRVDITDMYNPDYSAYMNEDSDYKEALKKIENPEKVQKLEIRTREEIQSSNFVHDRLKIHTIQ